MSCTVSHRSWTDPCTRSYVQSLPPFILILLVLGLSIPLTVPRAIRGFARVVKRPFTRFLPLAEAEALLQADTSPTGGEPSVEIASKPKVPLWRTICMSGLALVESILWLIIASYRVVASAGSPEHDAIAPFLIFLSWLPAVIIPVVRPTLTPPFDLFAFYLLQLVTGIFRFGAIWYDRDTLGIPANVWDVVASAANLAVLLCLLLVVLRMPLEVPSDKIDQEKIVCLTFCFRKYPNTITSMSSGQRSQPRRLYTVMGLDNL
jgi:hypothetical protein